MNYLDSPQLIHCIYIINENQHYLGNKRKDIENVFYNRNKLKFITGGLKNNFYAFFLYINRLLFVNILYNL